MRARIVSIFIIISFGLVAVNCVAVTDENGIHENGYDVRQIYSLAGAQNDVAIGDFDPNHAGNEIAVCVQARKVVELYHDGTSWQNKVIYTGPDPFEIFKAVAVGDANPNHPGDEVVVVTTNVKINATIIYSSGTHWGARQIFTDTDSLSSVAIGEINTTNPGEEIVIVGLSKNVTLIRYNGGSYSSSKIFTDTEAVRGVAIGDIDTTRSGNEIIVAGGSHNCNMLYYESGSWHNYQIYTPCVQPIAIGDFDSTNPGNEAVVTYGVDIHELYGSGSSWNSRKLWTAPSYPIDAIAVGEFNSSSPGDEIAASTYWSSYGRIEMITGSGTTWTGTTIFTNPVASWLFFGIACGEVDSSHTGNELIVAGENGKTFEIGYGKFITEFPIFLPLLATITIFVLLILRKKR